MPLVHPPSNSAGTLGRMSPAGQGHGQQRVYRLVDQHGLPHPVLDDLYETLEAAWAEALAWWSQERGSADPVGIGVEVSTMSGSWRTLRHPGS